MLNFAIEYISSIVKPLPGVVTYETNLLAEHILAGGIADDGRRELHVDLEHSLGRGGGGTCRVDQGVGRVWRRSPEALGATGVEVRDLHGFQQAELIKTCHQLGNV